MRRVVVTGLGIVPPFGNNAEEVLASLKAGKSGITGNEAVRRPAFCFRVAGVGRRQRPTPTLRLSR